MQIQDLIQNISAQVEGSAHAHVSGIQSDSRKVKDGDLFVAVRGTQVDGHDYINQAITNGAGAIMAETSFETELPVIIVPNSAEALGYVAATFYGEPSKQLNLVGITGTNGKTSTATLLFQLFEQLGFHCGLISTVENKIGEQIIPATHTTPDAIGLNQLLAEMVNDGCDFAFMEVSSHALHQHRTTGVHFTGAVFTNITHDHLDYHGTIKNYINAKKLLFDGLAKSAFALVNHDDKNGATMLQNCSAKQYKLSLRSQADYKAKIIENSFDGLMMQINDTEFHSPLNGKFNAYNLLTIYGVARCLDQSKEEVLQAMSQLRGAEGRFERVPALGNKIGIVDYAHTPDALEQVLTTIQQINSSEGKVITVVGCGGDRDTTKRPTMAATAAGFSDKVVLTSDNPRSENPETILNDMEKGITPHSAHKVLRITDRAAAIQTAVHLAAEGDIILVAGKGHEKYQEINGVKRPFDDKEILRSALNQINQPTK